MGSASFRRWQHHHRLHRYELALGQDDDQLTQMFTVGGLSTSNFFLYDTISAPSSNTIRVSGVILFPPTGGRRIWRPSGSGCSRG